MAPAEKRQMQQQREGRQQGEIPVHASNDTLKRMPTSLFDLFKIGIGPSSSHTVGPMRAAYRFAEGLADNSVNPGSLDRVTGLRIELFGSLGLTGRGHGTDRGVLLGLMGERPDSVDPATIVARVEAVRTSRELLLFGRRAVPFHLEQDLIFDGAHSLPFHPNGMRFTALPDIASRVFFSVGGGFVVEEGETVAEGGAKTPLPYPFTSADAMLEMGHDHQRRIDEMVLANELAWHPEAEIRSGIARIWQAMQDCTLRGLETEGVLPGGLSVVRRAPSLCKRLGNPSADPLSAMDWLNVWAIARQRRERRRRTRRHRAYQRRRRHHSRGRALLHAIAEWDHRRYRAVLPGRGRHRRIIQGECLDLGCGSRLPG